MGAARKRRGARGNRARRSRRNLPGGRTGAALKTARAAAPHALPGTERRGQKGGENMAKLEIPNTGSMTVKAPKPTASTKKPVVKTGK